VALHEFDLFANREIAVTSPATTGKSTMELLAAMVGPPVVAAAAAPPVVAMELE
jgi:hypothetical protein